MASKIAAAAASFAAVALWLALQLGLGPRWQAALGQTLAGALALAALLGFVRMSAWPAFSGLFSVVAVFDVFLLVRPPLPGSLVTMYVVMSVMAVLLYLSVYENQLRGLVKGFSDLFAAPEARWPRLAILALFPVWVGALVLAESFPELTPPLELRIVHPEPPKEISVYGKAFDMASGTNPLRPLKSSDPKRYQAAVAEGKTLYYKNCFYCHGDDLDGRGPYAHGLNPIPANFQDVGTIAMLQESFVFWRVAKGGPGLPNASHPWSSAMPVWEDMLTEQELWKTILYIYEGTGHEPRTFAPLHEEGTAP